MAIPTIALHDLSLLASMANVVFCGSIVNCMESCGTVSLVSVVVCCLLWHGVSLLHLSASDCVDYALQTLGPTINFSDECLRRIYGISRIAHVPNVEMLARCHTFSVESQLKTKRLRWFGHVC